MNNDVRTGITTTNPNYEIQLSDRIVSMPTVKALRVDRQMFKKKIASLQKKGLKDE